LSFAAADSCSGHQLSRRRRCLATVSELASDVTLLTSSPPLTTVTSLMQIWTSTDGVGGLWAGRVGGLEAEGPRGSVSVGPWNEDGGTAAEAAVTVRGRGWRLGESISDDEDEAEEELASDQRQCVQHRSD